MEMCVCSPQQKGGPHMCFVQVGLCTSTSSMAMGSDYMAYVGPSCSRRSKRLGLKAADPQIRIEQIAPTNRIARIAQLKENQTLLAPKAQGSALLRHIADNVGPRKSASGEGKILLQSVPATTPASSSMSSAEEQLRTLTGMLRKTRDQLTPETQAYLTTLNVQATRTTAKSLHSAVSKLEKAQNGLTEVQGARLQLHCKWRNFVTEAVERWTQSTEDFKKEDQIEAQIQATKDALPEIKEQYTQTHTQMGRKATAVEISDDEDNKIDAASAKISDGLQQMMGSLTHLKETADQMVEEQQQGGQTTLPWRRRSARRAVFYGARQDEALGSAYCLGHEHGTFNTALAYWTHSICDEPTFKSVWAASFEGLQAAFDLDLPLTS